MSTPEDTRACEVCGRPYVPKRRDQVNCSPDCRRVAWRRLHPTYDEMVAMPAEDLRRVLDRLADARGGAVLEHLPGTLPSFAAVALVQVAAVEGDDDFRAALRHLAEVRYPGRRGRLRVRFGTVGDEPMTDGVC